MRTILKSDVLVVIPESRGEIDAIASWKLGREGYVLSLNQNAGEGLVVKFLGPREEVCREPINVTSRHPDLQIQLISNFATTPFALDGRIYASVEGFWQSLKFKNPRDRERVAAMNGSEAKRAGGEIEYDANIEYEGDVIPVGQWQHWRLMERACEAKFTQCWESRSALLATGERPLQHKVRKDSRTIPGAIMAEIWMSRRAKLQSLTEVPATEIGDED